VAWDVKKLLIALAVLAALFWWSVWAGLAVTGAIVAWILWLIVGDAKQMRQLQQQSRARIEEALAAEGLKADSIFCSHIGAGALGVSHSGRKLVYVAPVSMVTDVYDSDAAFEAHAKKLPQGDFELAMTVPGRVTGKPRQEIVLVKRRSEAELWVKALEPLLGAKVKSDL
jgi:hypothetical protein